MANRKGCGVAIWGDDGTIWNEHSHREGSGESGHHPKAAVDGAVGGEWMEHEEQIESVA